MKNVKKQIKSIIVFLVFAILLKSCTVYRSLNVPIDQAVQNSSKVRIRTKSNEKLKYNRIEIENGTYYGVTKSNGQILKFPIDENSIKSINERNKTLTTILSIGIPVVIIGVMRAIGPIGYSY